MYLTLFLTFFKIGLFTFGGGYAMIPLLTEEAISTFGMTEGEILNFIAVSESTPGPIAVNMATFIGSSQGGILGALLATLGVILPSFIIILIIATAMTKLLQYAGVKAFLNGLRPVVVGLIVATGITIFLTVILALSTISSTINFDWKALTIFAVVAIVSIAYKKKTKKALSPIIMIIASAVLGLIFYGLF